MWLWRLAGETPGETPVPRGLLGCRSAIIMKQRPPTTPISLNLAPMVDVIMSLLVFFMVTTRMVEQENSLIDLPVARSAKNAEKQELGKRFVVNVRDLRLSGGEGAAFVVQEKIVSLSDITHRLEAEHAVDPDVNCVIRGDSSLPYQYVQAVMVACGEAGVRKVTFSAVPRAGGRP